MAINYTHYAVIVRTYVNAFDRGGVYLACLKEKTKCQKSRLIQVHLSTPDKSCDFSKRGDDCPDAVEGTDKGLGRNTILLSSNNQRMDSILYGIKVTRYRFYGKGKRRDNYNNKEKNRYWVHNSK